MKINNSLLSLYDKAQDLQGNDNLSLLEQISNIELRYLDKAPVGQGGMKKILSFQDEVTGRKVAMALLAEEAPEDSLVENFLREARITAALQHPNIVPVYDIGLNKDGKPYFTMKLLRGQTLEEFLKKKTSIIERLEVFKKICDGMAYAHSKGIIHLDLKPENIYVGNFGDVLICDWGLARILLSDDDEEIPADDEKLDFAEVSHMTLNGQVKGTPGFMAPEQVNSKSFKDQRTDIFSLGALLFYMLDGQEPFHGKNFEEVRQATLHKKPLLNNSNIPLSLQAIFFKAMEKQPENRYTCINEIIAEVENYQQGFATEAENAGLIRQLTLLVKRHKVIFSATALVFIIITLALFLFISQQEENLRIVAGKEKAAREALEKFEKEKTERLQVQKDSSHRYFLNAELMFRNLDFHKALTEVEKVLLFNPNMKSANALKAKILLSFYQIEEAIKYFKKADQHQKGFFRPLTDFCLPRLNSQTGRLDHDDYLTLVSMTPEPNTVVKYMMEDVFAQQMPIEERTRLVKEILLIRNPEISNLKFHYDEQSQTLSLQDNASLTNIDPVKFLPVKHLNLEGTAVTDLERIADMSLLSLNLSRTYVANLAAIKKMPLESLNISHTGITETEDIYKLPLKKLNIKNTRITELKSLKRLKGLQEIKADWQKFPNQKKFFKGKAL